MCNMSIIKHVFGQVWQVLRQVWQVLCQVLGRFDGFDVGFGQVLRRVLAGLTGLGRFCVGFWAGLTGFVSGFRQVW